MKFRTLVGAGLFFRCNATFMSRHNEEAERNTQSRSAFLFVDKLSIINDPLSIIYSPP
jgi:hypothetical protein